MGREDQMTWNAALEHAVERAKREDTETQVWRGDRNGTRAYFVLGAVNVPPMGVVDWELMATVDNSGMYVLAEIE